MNNVSEATSELRKLALATLLSNLGKTGGKYVCPSWPHYRNGWLWDTCAHAIVLAFLGRKEEAKNEIRHLLASQRFDGFIPHIRYQKRYGPLWELERFTFLQWMCSDYSQPPLIAQALWWIGDEEFTREVFERVVRFFLYFRERQDPDDDFLISNFHPGETGRDSSPEFDRYILRLPGRHRILNPALHGFSWFKREVKYRWMRWDIERIAKDDGFDVEDLMFNCIWVDGMHILAQLAPTDEERKRLLVLAQQTEHAILRHCWNAEQGMFYSLAKGNEQIQCLTVSNLFPLLLPGLPKDKAESLMKYLTDPGKFWTPYPIPSVAIDEPTFDPDRIEPLLWRGGSWIVTDWYLLQALMRQGYVAVAEALTARTLEMVLASGFREFYHPLRGEGMREPGFGWSTLVVTMPSIVRGYAPLL